MKCAACKSTWLANRQIRETDLWGTVMYMLLRFHMVIHQKLAQIVVYKIMKFPRIIFTADGLEV